MLFIPHTDDGINEMLSVIGIDSIENLFDEIPSHLKINGLENVPEGLNEMSNNRLMQQLDAKDVQPLCLIGAGSHEIGQAHV